MRDKAAVTVGGELEATWDAASFDAAAAAPPDSERHLQLVSTLLKTVASSHAEVVSHRGGNFVRFDKGLSLISQHAKNQGYDALISISGRTDPLAGDEIGGLGISEGTVCEAYKLG